MDKPQASFPARRMRRLRRTPALRRLVAETRLSVDDLVAPLFVREGIAEPQPVPSLPGVAQARAGADVVAPSGMMDGQVAAIRGALDDAGFTEVAVLAYAAKYASALYGPFRDAVDVTIAGGGDRKGYQQDPRNGREALTEVRLDLAEGADIVMVKPALAYLDVIAAVRAVADVPVAAYHVSGEYAMVKAAAQQGWIDGEAVALEHLTAIKRAGADVILTYYAAELAERLA